jgi:hypothetical protein
VGFREVVLTQVLAIESAKDAWPAACQQLEAYSERLKLCGRRWRNESSITERKCTPKATTEQQRGIFVVEEHSDGVCLIVYEGGRIKDKCGCISGYNLHPVLRKWYLPLKDVYQHGSNDV